jgi:hypothetical protein
MLPAFLTRPFGLAALVLPAANAQSRAMLAVNAGASSLAMMGLVVLGRCAGPSAGTSCIAPAWLAFNPLAVFVFGGFSESLFLLFETLFLIALIERWWWPAALMIAPLVATRFVGVIAIGWLVAYWSIHHRSRQLAARVSVPVGFVAVGASGVIADIIVKMLATGHPFAAFQISSAWDVASLGVAMGVLDVIRLREGNYLPVLLIGVATLGYVAFTLVAALRAGRNEAAILMAPGLSIVLATLALNPEIHSAGRYFLPLVPSIVDVLAFEPLRQRSLTVIALLTATGAAASGDVVSSLYRRLPPG